MQKNIKHWDILYKSSVTSIESLINILLKNRGIKSEKDQQEFIYSTNPMEIGIKKLKIKDKSLKEIINRLKKAKTNKEFVIVYGDYDADGITATAIIWETLHGLGLEALPFIPDRFEDGYGIKPKSLEKLKTKFPDLKLIVTVDNGIVAYEGVERARQLGIDVIVIDHHQKGDQELGTQLIIHDTSVCGSALSWFFSNELARSFKVAGLKSQIQERLALAAIGTIADQMPLMGINRSLVKFGLTELNNTKRYGLKSLYKEANISQVSPYEIGFVIAPRINSVGRLKNGLESLQLLCTKDKIRAAHIANDIEIVNVERQKVVDRVVEHSLKISGKEIPAILVLADENYHEGVIGLAAAKLVEKFYRPAIVISKKEEISKASARSITGFNIIEAIRKLNKYYIEGGGHPMAAGFSIKTKNIGIFTKKINVIAKKLLTDEILQKKIKVDCPMNFDLISSELINKLKLFDPIGLGNPQPVFYTSNVEVVDARILGKDGKHLKLKLKSDEHIFDSIYFGGGEIYSILSPSTKLEIVYSIDENIWNGYKSIQLKIRDLKLA